MAKKRIGMQLSSFVSDYNIDIFSAIEQECRRKKLDLVVFEGGTEYGNPNERQQQFIYKHVNRRNVDSMILTSASYNATEAKVKSKEEKALPVAPQLCITRSKEGIPCLCSSIEQQYAALITHLADEHGCRTFNIISGPKEHPESARRLNCCIRALAQRDILVEKRRLFVGSLTEESGYNALNYFIQKNIFPVDCIICLNDDMATGLSDHAKSLGFKVPDDFRIIGCNDTSRARYSYATLSTLCVDTAAHGRLAVEGAEQLMEGKELPPQTAIPSRAKYRKSCGCVSADDYATDYIAEDGTKVAFPSIADLNSELFSLEHDIFLMQRFFENHTNSLTVQSVIPELKSWLPTLHINSCAAVLFERKIPADSEKDYELPSRAELLFSYEKHEAERQDGVKDFAMFNPQQGMFPEHTFSDRARTLIMHSLYYDNFIYGYLAYEPGDLPKPLLDTTFSMIANMLNSAVIYTEKIAIERYQSSMLQQLRRSNTKLSGMSLTDELTKLYNRRGILNFGQQTIDLAVEMENHGLVFYADMDGLKKINDTFGHDAGDLAITTMGKILRKTFRNQDVIGRMGGDEFVIIATGIDEAFLPRIRERIDVAADQWYVTTRPDFRINISFGAVPFNEENKDIEKLLADADKLLYEEKLKKHSRSATKELLPTKEEEEKKTEN